MSGRAMARTATVALLLLLLSAGVSAHYEFIHYITSEGRLVSVPEKFDLRALIDKTLYYFVPSQGPSAVAPGDSYPAILSQIRLAASAWDGVATSDLRLKFGGFSAPGVTQATPGVDVLFGEVPPGLVALGGPTTRSTMVTRESGSFVPVTRSVLVLQQDLSQRPSYSEAFFLTVVHELGHALGLQHTLTSAVMSTSATRSTTKADPLAADDIAGISTLYPSAGFAAKTGTISGRVTLNGQAEHLASVVAIKPAGDAVSALTDADGYYRITGLPPGQYYLYAHPLPPGVQSGLGPADVVLPIGSDGNPVPAGPLFSTVFYPNSGTAEASTVIPVTAGSAFTGYDFSVQPRDRLDVYGVTTFSFPGSFAVNPAFLSFYGSRAFLVAAGAGLTANGQATPGLTARMIGGASSVQEGGVFAYGPAPFYLQVNVGHSPFAGPGLRHLVFGLNGDSYVLPSAVHVVSSQPPSVASVTAASDGQGNSAAVLKGSNFVSSTRILFDGLQARVLGLDPTNGDLTVVPPPGASGHSATVTALDLDGQSSLFLDSAPPAYAYGQVPVPSISVTPAYLPAGTEGMVEINGVNTSFTDGYTFAGFGSSDVAVGKLWVLSPTRLWANVRVADGAQPATLPATVISGFQAANAANSLQIQAAQIGLAVLNPTLINPVTGQPSVYAGGQASLSVSNLPAVDPAAVGVAVGGYPAQVLQVKDGAIVFHMPDGLGVGPATLSVTFGAAPVPQPNTIVVDIDPLPPVIQSVSAYGIIPIGPNWPAFSGVYLSMAVSGLADPDIVAHPERLQLTLGGIAHSVFKVIQSAIDPNVCFVIFVVSEEVSPGDSVPLVIAIDRRVSQPFAIPVVAER